MSKAAIKSIILIWMAWFVILISFMQLVQKRYTPNRPDEALMWTATETTRRSNQDKPYLLDPLLNSQVAWDSEYYLSIATVGYDDPDMRLIYARDRSATDEAYNTSYAFFPLYPYMMKVVRLPFTPFFNPIAASVIAGLIISLLGTLAGVIAIYDMVHKELGLDGGLRTVYLMLIFPTSFFFTTVYTEGLFIGLAFSSLALMQRKKLVWAAILAMFATWTRSIGGALLAPLLIAWWMSYRQAEAGHKKAFLRLFPVILLPLLAYVLWRMAFGTEFDFVQQNWFGNMLFQFDLTKEAWELILERAKDVPETAIIVVLGLTFISGALLSCLINLRRYPLLAIFGLVVLIVPLTSGWTGTQSSIRYVLAMPTLWVFLGQLSRNMVFERSWTLLSILLLATQAFLFSFDFWVA